MVMINFNQNKLDSGKLRIAASIVGISALVSLSLGTAIYAGPQSLLDPYANIQPQSSQPGATTLGDRTSTKKPHLPGKAKSAKVSAQKPAAQPVSTANSATASPSFLSGVKEISHGYLTVFKATGGGIINGAKSVGAKIAAGSAKIKTSFGAGASKIASTPKALAAKTPSSKKKIQANTVATANTSALGGQSNRSSNLATLPGKPLGPLADTVPHTSMAKPVVASKKNKNVVARTFDKLNIFAKHKQASTDIAANNQKPGG